MSTNKTAAAGRLGAAVLARRLELDLSQLDAWQSGGPSNSTLTTIENGRLTDLTRNTARKLDAVLRWEAGSARRIWEGTGQARPARPSVGSSDEAALRALVAEVCDENGWTASDVAGYARARGFRLSQRDIDRHVNLVPIPSITADFIDALAVGLQVSRHRVAQAAIQQMGYRVRDEDTQSDSGGRTKRGA